MLLLLIVATLQIEVRSKSGPVPGVTIVVNGDTHTTASDGSVTVSVQAGVVEITAVKDGFVPVTASVTVQEGQTQQVVIELHESPVLEEEVTVSATRTDKRLNDQPMRVEVLAREEIEEKMLMTPGDIVMMLNEMGGMRVQATSPSLGAASVRIQGMSGRYTRFFSDGLPLFGEVGGLGLLQIPPMDLGQVEVIKGVASSLYGAGAMGGVVNLLSRRPAREGQRELLLNRSTRGATDAVAWYATPARQGWAFTLLGGGHWQQQNDVNDDAWSDLPGYSRAVIRPRVFWDGGHGRTFFATAGFTAENRVGGGTPEGVPYVEALDTRRADAGAVGQMLIRQRYLVSMRGAVMQQRHDHVFGDVRERDRHETVFGEFTIRAAAGRHTLVAGAALERDAYRPRDLPRFAYTFTIPGVFAQDDVDIAKWLSLSVSGRLDHHSAYGAFVSPRVSALVRNGAWASRVSLGTGFFGPSPLTEETEAAGLTRLIIPHPLRAEEGRSTSLDVSRTDGPLSYTLTLFGSRIAHPIDVDRSAGPAARGPTPSAFERRCILAGCVASPSNIPDILGRRALPARRLAVLGATMELDHGLLVLTNREEPTTNVGIEALGTFRSEPYAVTATYTYVRAREDDNGVRRQTPLTPGHSAGLVGMWEREDVGRVGVELYYTGVQRLEENPFSDQSRPYAILGLLAERQLGRLRLFVNGENLTGVRQTKWDPLVRPSRAADGRWTVDAWAPLEGRNVNGGVRLRF